jgi:hypothetical protein
MVFDGLNPGREMRKWCNNSNVCTSTAILLSSPYDTNFWSDIIRSREYHHPPTKKCSGQDPDSDRGLDVGPACTLILIWGRRLVWSPCAACLKFVGYLIQRPLMTDYIIDTTSWLKTPSFSFPLPSPSIRKLRDLDMIIVSQELLPRYPWRYA